MTIVYVIQNTFSKELYIGITENLERRLSEHNHHGNTSTHRIQGEWMVVYAEAYRSKEDAEQREIMLKHHGSSKRKLFDRIKKSFL